MTTGAATAHAPTRSDDAAPLLSVRDLCKHFPVYSRGLVRRRTGTIRAVDGVSFDLPRGGTVGIVGESGSGKTTCARTILRALRPTSGSVLFRSATSGTVDLASLPESTLKPLRREMQMVFQDPYSSLNPRMTVGEIIAEPLLIHRLCPRPEALDRAADMLRRVGLEPDHRTRYPHAFSGGQRQRIGIARALVMRPSLVVADEAVSALDVSVQAQVLNLLKDLQEEFGLTYIFVAHDLSVVRHFCDTVAVMYAGRLVEIGPTAALFDNPRHPYTQALLSAIAHPDPDRPVRILLSGDPADPANLPTGCPFHPRCPHAVPDCSITRPPLAPTSTPSQAACLLAP